MAALKIPRIFHANLVFNYVPATALWVLRTTMATRWIMELSSVKLEFEAVDGFILNASNATYRYSRYRANNVEAEFYY